MDYSNGQWQPPSRRQYEQGPSPQSSDQTIIKLMVLNGPSFMDLEVSWGEDNLQTFENVHRQTSIEASVSWTMALGDVVLMTHRIIPHILIGYPKK